MNVEGRSRRLLIFRPTLGQGGADRVTITLAKELDRKLFDITLVLMRAEGEFLEDAQPDVKIISLNARNLWTAWLPLSRVLHRHPPDILLSTCGGASLPATVAWLLTGRQSRLVLSERNVLFRGERSLKRLLLALSKGILFRFADEIISVSDGVAQDLRGMLRLQPGRISIVYNPVVSEELEQLAKEPVNHPWFRDEVPILLAVGRLVPQKDFETLLDAFSLIRSRTTARLVILGEGFLETRLRRKAAELGIADKVWFAGFDKNPFKYMSKCMVYVLSSRSEGLPGSLIQAMACGAPVVATDCHAGPAEIIQNGRTGYLVPVGDAEKLADRIIFLLDNPSQREELARAGQRSVERFRVASSVEAYTRALTRPGSGTTQQDASTSSAPTAWTPPG